MKTVFNAPWGAPLIWITCISSALVLGLSLFLPAPPVWYFWWPLRLFGPLLVTGTALFTIRRYEVTRGCLWVQRLFWKTQIPLASLSAVEFRPGPFDWAWRTCGNGGVFSFSGWYYQKPLGSFRALATSVNDAVILKFNDRKPIVVTPETPEAFAQAIREEAMKSKPQ